MNERQIIMNKKVLATEKWCNITNALIKKYKTMTENDYNNAYAELGLLENALISGGFLTLQELGD